MGRAWTGIWWPGFKLNTKHAAPGSGRRKRFAGPLSCRRFVSAEGFNYGLSIYHGTHRRVILPPPPTTGLPPAPPCTPAWGPAYCRHGPGGHSPARGDRCHNAGLAGAGRFDSWGLAPVGPAPPAALKMRGNRGEAPLLNRRGTAWPPAVKRCGEVAVPRILPA